MKNKYLFSIPSALVAFCASAQIVSFDGTSVSTPGSIDSNLNTAGFSSPIAAPTVSFGIMQVNGSGWETGDSVVLGGDSFLQLTIEPDAGFQVSLTSFSFDIGTPGFGGVGASRFAVAINGSQTGVTIGDNILPATAPASRIASPITGVSGLTGPITIRIYAFGTDGAGIVRFDNLSLSGSVTPVPEPSHIGFAAALALVGFGLYRRTSK